MFYFEAAGTMRWREDLEVTTASCFEETRSWADESSVHLVSVIATSDRQVRVRSACKQSALPISTQIGKLGAWGVTSRESY